MNLIPLQAESNTGKSNTSKIFITFFPKYLNVYSTETNTIF
ncbi:protein of unknown function [Shewanella benthica]|uniref:Uncharacterized protein n=1 Tax=Shewanella benthica TaxID=43661 RepID=A0A330M8A3_9GAMM|nr:protein of unknown function [Shewanella benthica]